ncbi:MAG: arylsulfatase, partial [Planctomycetota bacterium]
MTLIYRRCVFCFFVAAMASSAKGHAADLPNVVIIYADDMGYGDLAIQNPDSSIPTPHLDRLAREGVRFTDAHSSSGICTPSRYSLLTGRYHWRKFHQIVRAWEPSVFDADRLTLPEMLRDHGYRTACIGKWHLGFDWDAIRIPGATMVGEGKKRSWTSDAFDWKRSIPGGPLDHGFDEYFGDDVPNFPPYAWIENDRVVQPPTVPYRADPVPIEGAAEGRPGPMVAGWKQDAVMPTLTRRAVEWIRQQKEENGPFFLYWSWTSPHAPIVPTDSWKGTSNAGAYGDFMAQSDAHAGELLEALDEHGFRENTIVIFSADNGPESYAFERIRKHGHVSSGPLRGVKRDIWEGGHRVPFVVRWPSVLKPGLVADGLISQTDIMATLAGIIGAELPEGTAEDSHDQLGFWKGGSSARKSMVHNTYEDD